MELRYFKQDPVDLLVLAWKATRQHLVMEKLKLLDPDDELWFTPSAIRKGLITDPDEYERIRTSHVLEYLSYSDAQTLTFRLRLFNLLGRFSDSRYHLTPEGLDVIKRLNTEQEQDQYIRDANQRFLKIRR